MSGLTGGVVGDEGLRSMLDAMHHDRWQERAVFHDRPFGLGVVHHGDQDPGGHTIWKGDSRVGAIYGTVTNPSRAELSNGDIVTGVLENPETVLPELDGPFFIACYDASRDRYVLATDKIGSRACYYTTRDRFLFGSELKSLLSQLRNPSIDEQAVSDLLFIGSVWGTNTLVDSVRSLPAGSVLEYENGETTTTSYWSVDFDPAASGRGYSDELATRYRNVIGDIAATFEGPVGAWLSGGLDSRSMVAELNRQLTDGSSGALRAYTYDSNPPGAGNPKLAREIGREIGIGVEELALDPARIAERLPDAVYRTDGMTSWHYLVELTPVYSIANSERRPILEACGQGELLGEMPWRYHLTQCDPVESMCRSDAINDRDLVREVLAEDHDPTATFRSIVRSSDETDPRGIIMDAHYTFHYSRGHAASTRLYQGMVGTRTPFANGAFLDHVGRLPIEYRIGSIPFTDGKVPAAVSQSKLELIRRLDPNLAAIPYERTLLPPSYPHLGHVMGYVYNKGTDVLRSELSSEPGLYESWWRDDATFRPFINDLIDGAVERELFDGDVLRRLQREHLSGESNHIGIIAPVTTVELWMRRHPEVSSDDTRAKAVTD